MIKRGYLYIFSILAIVFSLTSFFLLLGSMSSVSINFGDIMIWAGDSFLHYNSSYYAGLHMIFFLIVFLIMTLSFIVMIPILIKKRNYLLNLFLLIFYMTFIFSLMPILTFIYYDYNFGLNGIGIIDVDIYMMVVAAFGLIFSIGTLVMTILNMKKTTFKYDPVVIHNFKN